MTLKVIHSLRVQEGYIFTTCASGTTLATFRVGEVVFTMLIWLTVNGVPATEEIIWIVVPLKYDETAIQVLSILVCNSATVVA